MVFPEGLSGLSKPYYEAGAGIENIFKLFRIDAIWRFSYLDHPHTSPFGIRAHAIFILGFGNNACNAIHCTSSNTGVPVQELGKVIFRKCGNGRSNINDINLPGNDCHVLFSSRTRLSGTRES